MSINAGAKIFSIESKGLKLNTAEDVQEFVNSISEIKNLEQVILSGNTFGVEAAQAIAGALKGKKTMRIVNASDIFTGRLREEIPHAVKAFCDALKENEQLVELNFSDNAFGPAGAEPMVEFLSNNKWFQVLKLNNNGLGTRGGTLIGKALLALANKNVSEGRNSSFRTIIAGRNRLEDGSSQALANAFAAHGTLTEIRMPQNGIRPDGIITLLKGFAACKNLEVLDLQDNTFTEKGSVAFAKALVEWPNLRVLNIGDCLLSAKGGVAIAEALLLGHNKNLETLNLQYNEIDSEGVNLLATVISTHLKSLSSLELNGNKVDPEDISIKNVRIALEENGYADALGELDDMEVEDEESEEDEEQEEDDVEEVEKISVVKNEVKLNNTTELITSSKVVVKETKEFDIGNVKVPTVSKKLEKLPVKETKELDIGNEKVPTVSKKLEKLPVKETKELDIGNEKVPTVSKKLEKLPVKELEDKEDLVDPQKSENRTIEAKTVEDKTHEINKDQGNQVKNSEDQVETLRERITKVQILN